MRIGWHDLGTRHVDAADGRLVEITGFPVSPHPARRSDHFMLVAEPGCCAGCAPCDPLAAIEVFAATPLPMQAGALRLTGAWRVLRDDPAGARYHLTAARTAEPVGWSGITRRAALFAGPLVCFASGVAKADTSPPAVRSVLEATPAIDLHSHAGGIASPKNIRSHSALGDVAEPMKVGGMAVACLAVVSDGPTHILMPDGRLHPFREPNPGELYAYGQQAFARVLGMVHDQGLALIMDTAGLRAARAGRPSAIIAAEGADFLEGQVDRVDEAYAKWHLRHLQLTHYRVNELGDIQTEAPVHNGLTDTGAEVIRRCNRLGIVVDVAHATYPMVVRAAAVTTKPMVLSHTSFSRQPSARSRLISAEHAKVVAGTGGVIGVWPPVTIFSSLPALAAGMARMVDVVGIDHVGLGSDMRGLPHGSIFPDYDSLPGLTEALLDLGFSAQDAGKLLGGNYARVFAATMG
jgi:membrane dipeptidase